MNSAPLPVSRSRLAPVLQPLHAFLAAESTGGIVLIVCAVAALIWANSPWADVYHHLWHMNLSLGAGGRVFSASLQHCVNDGLMVIFFLLVGLEIKRELLVGELASPRRAALPFAAAIGGMVVPALIYAAFNARREGSAGWGIPMATDIAFAVGVLTLLGRSAPTSLKVFLLAVAIVDDLGAVLVIAIFYSGGISATPLAFAAAIFALLIALNLLSIHRPLPYLLLGFGLWVATLFSGIHATIAGVLLAFTIPASRQIEEHPYVAHMRNMLERFEVDASIEPDRITEEQSHALKSMEEASQAVQTPLATLEHALLMPVNLLIIPLFALANAGVDVRGGGGEPIASPVTWGVLLGLVIGKPLGVLLATWVAIKSGAASPPEGASPRQIAGVATLCGIGFTMSLFVANLAFGQREDHLQAAKVGILAASLLCGIVGAAVIASTRRPSLPES
jgi:NhaA family Na+:H+ antiporter